MTTIYWIRHGEAEGNLYRRCHGQYDSLITPNGREQLNALRARFADIGIDAVYSSDLYRAWLTAHALASERGQPVTALSSFREIAMGIWEDLTWIEIGRRWERGYADFTSRPWKFSIKGGESVAGACERALSALYQVAARHPGQTVAVVSHGVVTRALMARIRRLPETRMADIPHGDNTSVSKLTFDGKEFGVEYYADNGHLLEGGLSTLARQQWWRDKGGLDHGFWFRPVRFPSESELVEQYRSEAWMTIYGNLSNFSGPAFVEEARRVSERDPGAVLFAINGERPAGMLQIDYNSSIMYGAGHIAFLYLSPEYRGAGLGVQLLGQAVSACRAKGCHSIALRVYENNLRAVGFYKKYGFTQFGEEPSFGGKLMLMSIDIRIPAVTS